MAERPKPVPIERFTPNNRLLKKLFDKQTWVAFPEPTTFDLEPDLHRRLKLSIISQGPRNFDSEVELADDLYSTYVQGSRLRRVVPAYLDLAGSIREVHMPLERKTKPRSVYVVNRLLEHIADHITLDHAEAARTHLKQLLLLQANNLLGTYDEWYYNKLTHLEMKLDTMKDVYAWIGEMKKKIDIKGLDLDDLRDTSDRLVDRIWDERNYGVKDCFFPSPLLLSPDTVFTVFDERLGTSTELRRDLPTNMLAYVAVTRVPERVQEPEVVERASQEVRELRIYIEGLKLLLGVDMDGELRIGVGHVPLKKAFEKKGVPELYELTRLFILMRLHDLTADPELVSKLPSLKDFEDELTSGKGRIKDIPYKVLTLPRTKPEAYVKTDESGKKRFVDRHKVVWHVRKLPEGYHATDRAIAYAKEHHVKLEEGETIVREHFRGEGNKNGSSKLPTKALF